MKREYYGSSNRKGRTEFHSINWVLKIDIKNGKYNGRNARGPGGFKVAPGLHFLPLILPLSLFSRRLQLMNVDRVGRVYIFAHPGQEGVDAFHAVYVIHDE